MSRFPGNIIKLPNVTPTQSSASGVWSLKDQMVYQRNNLWPFQRDPYFNYTTLLLQGNVPNTTGPQAMNLPLSYNADASTNNFLVTPNGDVGPRPFSPYFGGNYSVFFDGATSTRLTLASSSDFAFGTGAYTIEAWVYLAAYASNGNVIFDTGNASSSLYFTVGSSGALAIGKQGTGYLITSANSVVALNTWVHVAISRSSTSSNDTRLFVNGVFVAVGTDSNNWTVTTTPTIGGINASGYTTTGYISNLSVLKGTAKYTTNFTPTAQALPTGTTNQVLLACASNRFIDTNTATTAKAITVNGDSRITDNSPFVSTDFTTGAGYFNGTTDYLSVGSAATDYLGTGSYTMEAWVYLTDLSATRLVMAKWGAAPTYGWAMYVNTNGSVDVAGTPTPTTAAGVVTVNQWVHLVNVRSGNDYALFANGTRVSYLNSASNPIHNTTIALEIGRQNATAVYMRGYISNSRIVKGTAVYNPTLTTLTNTITGATGVPTAPLEPITNTQVLTLQTRAPSQNINFIDSSPNEFIVTKNGNTTQGTFSPFSPTGWGNYFDGTNDYIATGSNNLSTQFGTGAYTVECWIYQTARNPNSAFFIGGSGSNFQAAIDPNGYLNCSIAGSGAYALSTSAVPLNTWTHIAFVRASTSSNGGTMYINGQAAGSYTDPSNYSSATTIVSIGTTAAGSPTYVVSGYISNLRVVKGTAVYTGAFTPPTSPLTATQSAGPSGSNIQAITGTQTSLLTCQSNRFVDNSASANALTPTNGPSVQAFSPFAPANAVSPLVTGGSGYFDGSSDYLQLTDSANQLDLGGIQASLDFWIYMTNTAVQNILSKGGGNSGSAWSTTDGAEYVIAYNSGVLYLTVNNAGGTLDLTGNFTTNQWNHVAIATNTSNAISMYINGSRVDTDTNAITKPTNRTLFRVGTFLLANWTYGYLTNIRHLRGDAAFNPSDTNIVVPTTPPTAIPNTSLLLNFTNGGIVDATGKNNLETVANSGVQTSVIKYGNGSMYFDRTDDYLKPPPSQLYAFGTGDFTVECWVRFLTTTVSNGQGICQFDTAYLNSTTNGPAFGTNHPSGKWAMYVGATPYEASTLIPAINTWYHVALVRYSGTTKLYVDGTAVPGLSQADTNNYTRQYLTVGGWYSTAYLLNGYISNFRVTRFARYTSDFNTNLPSGPFPIG
jgi:hypothetical protein